MPTDFLLQEFIKLETDKYRQVQDYRYLVARFNNKIRTISFYGRRAVDGGLKTNLIQGGKLFKADFDPIAEYLAHKTISTLDAEFLGVDIAKDIFGNYWVIEANICPYYDDKIEVITGDISRKLIAFYLESVSL